MAAHLIETLKGLKIFARLDPEPLQQLASQGTLLNLIPGQALFTQGDRAHTMYLVLEGNLEVSVHQNGRTILVGRVGPGDPVGEMQVLAGGQRVATVSAAAPCQLLCIPNSAIRTVARDFPPMAALLNDIILQRLRTNQLVFTLLNLFETLRPEQLQDAQALGKWLQVARGEVLFGQGQKDDNLYLIISGRFRVTCPEANGQERPVAEVGRGETIGEMSMLSGAPRSATVTAIRDSEVVCFSGSDFTSLLMRYPRGFFNLTTRVVDRLRQTLRQPAGPSIATNILLLPADPSVPLNELTERLAAALEKHGLTLTLNAEKLDRMLQRPASRTKASDPFDLTLSAWMDEQERIHRFVLLKADGENDAWRFRCMRRADCVLLVTNRPPGREIRTLLFCGDDRKFLPANERYLVSLGETGSFSTLQSKPWMQDVSLTRHIRLRQGTASDLGRLARHLAGKALGLVLGGGGARALAQIGVIDAMRRNGFPIDMVGGCSMGAVVGAMHCMGWSTDQLMEACREAFTKRNPLSDYTFPKRALVKGKVIEAYLQSAFGETFMEDLNTEFFCVSSDLRNARLAVHSTGLLWEALRASLSMPGILPPVAMDDMLLVDGAMLNNLPVDIMKKAGGGFVVAVDVTQPNRPLRGDIKPVSGEQKSLSRAQIKEPSPSIVEVIMRSLCLGSARSVQENSQLADLYINLPLVEFGFTDFKSLGRLVAMGREHAETLLKRNLENLIR